MEFHVNSYVKSSVSLYFTNAFERINVGILHVFVIFFYIYSSIKPKSNNINLQIPPMKMKTYLNLQSTEKCISKVGIAPTEAKEQGFNQSNVEYPKCSSNNLHLEQANRP